MSIPEVDIEGEELEGEGALLLACFRVGDLEVALDIMRIKEVVRPGALAPVPWAPGFIEGIVELRGEFLPVIDLTARLGRAAPADPTRRRMVIVGLEGLVVGLLVDRITEAVRRVARDQVRPPPVPTTHEARFLAGVVKLDDRVVMLLELDRVLSPAEKAALHQMEDAE